MGGFGSGRTARRRHTGNCLRLSLATLKRLGILDGRSTSLNWNSDGERIASIQAFASPDRVRLCYQSGGRSYDYPVHLTYTACHYGGHRPWFLCPRCARRVAVLYGGSVFLCRQCHNLGYESQTLCWASRSHVRCAKFERRVGYDGDYYKRPKGMHHATFNRICDRLDWESGRAHAQFLIECKNLFLLPKKEREMIDEVAEPRYRISR